MTSLLAVGAFVSMAGFMPETAVAQQSPAITVTPDAVVYEGAVVSVTGTGFTATSVAYAQCPERAATITDVSVLQSICSNIHTSQPVDSQGGFTFDFAVVRTVQDGTDCAVDACIIGVRDVFGSTGEAAFAPIALGIPPAPGSLTVTPDTGLADAQQASISGSDFLPSLPVTLAQCPASAVPVTNIASLEALCGGETSPVADGNGDFTVNYQVLKVRPNVNGGGTIACGSTAGDCVITALQQASGRRTEAAVSFASPPVILECAVGTGGAPVLTIKVSGFPTSETFLFFTAVEKSQGHFDISQGGSVTTDETGAASIPVVGGDGLPSPVGFALYRDTNPNSRWDPSGDETLFRGDATVTACPQTVTVSPK